VFSPDASLLPAVSISHNYFPFLSVLIDRSPRNMKKVHQLNHTLNDATKHAGEDESNK